jgi:hypothetical protein
MERRPLQPTFRYPEYFGKFIYQPSVMAPITESSEPIL